MMPLPAQASMPQEQLVCTPSSVRFGAVQIGQSETQLVVLTNTGQTSVTISSTAVGGSQFSVSGLNLPASLTAGQSVAVNLTFAPTTAGWTDGRVTFSSNASNSSLKLEYGGTGATNQPLSIAPASLSFGQVSVGASATLPVVVTNKHSWSETVKALPTSGNGYSVSGPSVPFTLGAGQTVTLNVTFAPQASGPSGGSLFLSGPAQNIPLSGNATTSTVGLLAISPATLNFGNVMVGETGTQTAVLSATGGNVTISSAASNNSQYALPGVSFPVTIPAGQSVQVNVTFTPQKAATVSANLSFSSNASDATDTEVLSGTGTMPQVSLGWSPSTSSVQGYNVYRGTSPGQYTKINSSLDQNTSFTDATVSTGVTYYYAATAVNSSGQESAYSTPVEVAVP